MSSSRCAVIAAALLGSVAAAGATTLQLAAVGDTFVNSEDPTINFGASSFAEVGVLGPPKFDVERALLSFDLSSVPDGAPIARVVLRFLVSDAAPDPPNFSATVLRLASGFDENTVTWDTQPASLPVPAATAVVDAPIGSLMEIDVTGLVRAQRAAAAPEALWLVIAKTDESPVASDTFFDLATKEADPPRPAVLVVELLNPAPAVSGGLLPLVLVVLAATGALALRRRAARSPAP
ncbi:MAG: DNRLRE domain-containing protein, partial [Deltaproteobacteria bacterium]|nr:DNRLRE domain-containing protein [Deltaproteobacteria bacterium]